MTRSNRRPLVAGALAVGAALATGLLGACGSGQIAQTAQIETSVPGVNAQASDRAVEIRNASVDYRESKGYPAGGSAPLSLWIFNTTHQAVRLVRVTAALGTGDRSQPVQILQSGGAAASAAPCVASPSPKPPSPPSPSPVASSASPSPSGSARASGRPSGSASPSASPTGSPSPAGASPSPSAAGSATISVTVPADGCVELSRRAAQYLQAVDLPDALGNADSLQVTFQFTAEDGQSFTIGGQPSNSTPLPLPVSVPASAGPRPSVTGVG